MPRLTGRSIRKTMLVRIVSVFDRADAAGPERPAVFFYVMSEPPDSEGWGSGS